MVAERSIDSCKDCEQISRTCRRLIDQPNDSPRAAGACCGRPDHHAGGPTYSHPWGISMFIQNSSFSLQKSIIFNPNSMGNQHFARENCPGASSHVDPSTTLICIKNDEFCSKNDEFCNQNDGF